MSFLPLLKQGLFPSRLLEDLKLIVYKTPEESVVINMQNALNNYYKNYKLHFFINILSRTLVFLSLALTPYVKGMQLIFLYITTAIFALLGYIFNQLRLKYWNISFRYIRDLLDNVIKVIIDKYRISLAAESHKLPDVKRITNFLYDAIIAYNFMGNIISSQIGINISLLIILILWGKTHNYGFLVILITAYLLELLFILVLFLGQNFIRNQAKYNRITTFLDKQFKDTSATSLFGLIKRDYSLSEKRLMQVAKDTCYINAITVFIKKTMPGLIPLIVLLTSINSAYAAILLYTSTSLLGEVQLIAFISKIKIGQKWIERLEKLVSAIKNDNSTMSNKDFENLKQRFLLKTSTKNNLNKIPSYAKKGLYIKNLEYRAGRQQEYNIIIPELYLTPGSTTLIIAPSGTGKSLFGRTLTMRYKRFDAEILALNNTDLRLYKDLDEINHDIMFSTIREIQTSYRKAVAVYLRYNMQTTILEYLKNNHINYPHILEEYADMYKVPLSVKKQLINYFTTIRNKLSSQYLQNYLESRKDKFYKKLSILYKKISSPNSLNLKTHKNTHTKIATILAITINNYTFNHLLKYIPKATPFFMDAILSEPPISQGERRRVLHAIDTLLIRKVAIFDEPFSNLDLKTAKSIFLDLQNYATKYNSIVIILDQKVPPFIYKLKQNRPNIIKVKRKTEKEYYFGVGERT